MDLRIDHQTMEIGDISAPDGSARSSMEENEADLNDYEKNQPTPLQIAVYEGNFDEVKMIIDSGADVNYRRGFEDLTPLHIAAMKGDLEVLKFLLTYKADMEIQSQGGYTALHLATNYAHIDVTEALIEHGADVFHKSNHCTVLHEAVRNIEILKLVLDQIKIKSGEDVDQLRSVINATDTEGNTPLIWAVNLGNLSTTKLLLECHEIDKNKKTLRGWTVLHLAAHHGQLSMVKLLVNKKVDPKIKNNIGDTAYDLAKRKISEDEKYKIIADFLLKLTKSSGFRRLLQFV